jgi:GDPmannose 4,6-dehydratase
MAAGDIRNLDEFIKAPEPTEIYTLSGQSSVGLSFEQPVETLESISVGTLNLLEGIRTLGLASRYYNAGSSECFGDTGTAAADENTSFRPRSPYAVAKCAAHWIVANYRECYGIFACSGILFNHESPLRPERYVTQKIAAAARRIAAGSGEPLVLGNLDVSRDWGWAPEYVVAMWKMLERPSPRDYVIATGRSYSLREFVDRAFRAVGLDAAVHVRVDEALSRPTDIAMSRGDPARASAELGWHASTAMPEVARAMVASRLLDDVPAATPVAETAR